MKHLLTALLVLSFSLCSAQSNEGIYHLSEDSLNKFLKTNWRFSYGDDSSYADPRLNDSSWTLIKDPSLNIRPGKEPYQRFDSVGWLRLHIITDSTLVNTPLAISMTHAGASEVYVDGKYIESFGVIGKEEDCKYFNPNGVPLVVKLETPGPHLLAIRYANYKAWENYRTYHKTQAGVDILICEANGLWINFYFNKMGVSSVFLFIFTYFFSFFLLHIFLFAFNRKDPANLYFSLFCLAFGGLALFFYLEDSAHMPFIILAKKHLLVVGITLVCFSLSGFLNTQFGKQGTRFLIISLLAAITLTVLVMHNDLGILFSLFLVPIVSAEAVWLIVRALYKRQKGAAIVGTGILCFNLFILVCIILIFSGRTEYLNDSTEIGKVFLSFMLIFLLSIPTTMSVYLSRKFATINKHLSHQLKQVETLSAKTLEQEIEKQRLLENRKEELEKEVLLRTSEVVAQKQKSDDLLRNILPEEVAEELKEKGATAARYFDHVSVLFTDFVDFTKAGERLTPQQLVDELHACFKAFDEIISKYNIEKIKTIGDAYLAVSGLPISDAQHAVNITRAALEIRSFIAQRKQQFPDSAFNIRIGIHSGAVVAGIVGVKKFAYDIWGDTVNTAARMEQNSESGKINISQSTYDLVKEKFACTYRGKITAKNKGELNMYFVESEL